MPEYLPTEPGTQVSWSTSRPWCAGHSWRWRRGLGWVHYLGHRARVLRVKAARPLVYVPQPEPGEAEPGETECYAAVLGLVLGLMLADLLAHPAGAAELVRPPDA